MSAQHLQGGHVQTEARFKLPGTLPAGERVLWQGAPHWRALARDALHVRGLALYLGLIVTWVASSAAWHGLSATEVALKTGGAALIAAAPVALAFAYAWLAARAAAYTITNQRVVIRMGVGLQLNLNLPFSKIDAAALTPKRDGTGSIALKLAPGAKGLGWIILWPHARPWTFGAAQPMLRSLPDAARAGRVLAEALAATAAAPVPLASETEMVDSADCQKVLTAPTPAVAVTAA